jgi:diacylglycerol kinase (ATP)
MNPVSPPNPYKGRTGLDRIVHATGYSWSGLRAAYRNESAFRQETWLFIAALPLAIWWGRSWLEVLLLAGSVWLVLVVELLNSAVEAVVDRVSLEPNELAGRAKDFGSAAVLLTLTFTACVWLTITWQRFFG